MGTLKEKVEGAHGLVVRGAMTANERWLTGIVLAANLALVGWLVSRADFSELRPNAEGERTAADVATPPDPIGPVAAIGP